MNYRLMRLIVLALLCGYGHVVSAGGGPSKKAISSITAEDARRHLTLLASDEMKGRSTPSPELERAGDYVIDQFRQIGLQPVNGKYYHSFHLNRIELGPLEKHRLSFQPDQGAAASFALKEDFVPFSESGPGSIKTGLVFAGYGLIDPDTRYDDYDGIDVRNKIVIILQGYPRMGAYARITDRRELFGLQRLSSKIQRAVERGAAAVLVINDFFHGRNISARGYPWPQLNKVFAQAPLPTVMPEPYENRIPVISVGERIVSSLFGDVELLRGRLREIDSLGVPRSGILPGTMELECPVRVEKVELRNIVGLLPGSDEALKKEIVVIGAHYDHVGSRQVPDGKDGIYNGADDNASGTTGVIEIARAYAINDRPPRRSILFIAFAGEEKGLLGSRAYVRDPLFPIRDHAAMFNLDMIGRNNPDSLSIGGESHCPALMRINEEENASIGFTLAYNIEQYFFRSDQASFAQEKIPAIFYFTGEHEDYHKVSDEVRNINFDKLVRVARLCFLTSWRVANLDDRLPVVDPEK